ncbi:deoxynucleoside triphosphate triphosphohydrolase SAMHD1 [Anabrus simplex]|uniref:deoxynucleoside triphosphate triphosphohydrolase SAMHD1 n=1 Tax=Anabrus simplex TaxID=316456 RepID=UPI0035A36614
MDKIFNDCLYGQIRVPAVCATIIDTSCFQRLRNIKQLGVGYYVYPSACHNRFEHCLGVCYLTGQMVEALNKNSPESLFIDKQKKICLQIAALCHDLGHGPFSHLWEVFVKEANEESLEKAKTESWKHERSSSELLDLIFKEEKVLNALTKENLNDEHKQFIKDLILGKRTSSNIVHDGHEFLFEIINNQLNGIDVDKWDYLSRDGYMMNLKVLFDYRRLLENARIIKAEDDKYHICYRDKVAMNIYLMYRGRAELHYVGYQHRVVRIIERMLVDALIIANKNGYTFLGCKLSKAQDNPEVFAKMTDNILYDILYSSDEMLKDAQELLQRIQTRDFYKHVVTCLPENYAVKEEKDDAEEKVCKKCKDYRNLDLVMVKVEMNIPEELIKNVYIYQKTDLNNATLYKHWPNASVFPLDMKKMKHLQLYIYAKKQLDDATLKNVSKEFLDLFPVVE